MFLHCLHAQFLPAAWEMLSLCTCTVLPCQAEEGTLFEVALCLSSQPAFIIADVYMTESPLPWAGELLLR